MRGVTIKRTQSGTLDARMKLILKLQRYLMGRVLGRTHLSYLKFLMEEILFSFELDLPDTE